MTSARRYAVDGAMSVFAALCMFGDPTAAVGQEAVSNLPEIKATRASTLPEGPRPLPENDNCSSKFAKPETAAGRYVQQRGWGVISDVAIGEYQLVSFAGEFVPGTSGSCAIRQGNIGVFEGADLTAILYTSSKSDQLIGTLAKLENGSVRLWNGDYLSQPVADIVAGSIGLVVDEVASEEAFCGGTVSVPNVYGVDITNARTMLQSADWEPVEQPREERGQQPDLQDLGVIETETCSGTGFGFCRYAYKAGSASLSVTSVGELYEDSIPSVAYYSVTCSD